MEAYVMNAEINPNILKKVDKQPENIKNFLYEILELEYSKIDEESPNLKEDYMKLIKFYKK